MSAIFTGSPCGWTARSKIACRAYSVLTEIFIGYSDCRRPRCTLSSGEWGIDGVNRVVSLGTFMDILWFLERRLQFVWHLYRRAVLPFRITKRKSTGDRHLLSTEAIRQTLRSQRLSVNGRRRRSASV